MNWPLPTWPLDFYNDFGFLPNFEVAKEAFEENERGGIASNRIMSSPPMNLSTGPYIS